ncbi:MAG: hypothetical protein KKA10_07955 [Euryarchaeota archaeon]|nr:hypothetical protein [Euryarchaeota archaeon]MCG2736177.1 hypothetical protein [Candidatus Methanoperedenaceae archaeon]
MSEIKDWLSSTKQEKPEISDFITSLESYFSDAGFDASKFEKAVDTSLKSVENEVRNLFKDDEHAQD